MKQLIFTPEGVENCQVEAWLQPVLPGYAPRINPAMVVVPGGGYGFVASAEGDPVAQKYFGAGFSTFILTYSVNDRAKNFEPLSQLAATVAYIRGHAEQLCIDPEKIAVVGFSAGGHLAASLATLYNDPVFLAAFPQTQNIRPNAVVLSYPVITADEYTHEGTLENVSGGAVPGTPEYTYWGLHDHVDANTPPVFLWHTAEDTTVPVENSLAMAAALSKAKVPFELHIFPRGCHGMSVCNHAVCHPDAYNGRWMDWSITWLTRELSI